MRIRKANKTDAETIAHLHAQSWMIVYQGIFVEDFLDKKVIQNRREVWQKRFENPSEYQVVFLAEQSNELCGFACAFGNEDEKLGTFVDNLHIRKGLKRQGIGKLLMKETALWSKRHFPKKGLYLKVLEANVPALRFYESLGGEFQGSRQIEAPGGGLVTDCLYTWQNPDKILARLETQ